MSKHLGFTGSITDLPKPQVITLKQVLSGLRIQEGYGDLHHGDCVGGDDLCDRLARNRGYDIHIHPPIDESRRAFCERRPGTFALYKPKPFLQRDDDIAKLALALIACPKENHIEVQRSGVWATVRYARKYGKRVYIIWPDGRLEIER